PYPTLFGSARHPAGRAAEAGRGTHRARSVHVAAAALIERRDPSLHALAERTSHGRLQVERVVVAIAAVDVGGRLRTRPAAHEVDGARRAVPPVQADLRALQHLDALQVE